jgi:protein-L-isoaspartate(D-aspartate) O-methyltransferase
MVLAHLLQGLGIDDTSTVMVVAGGTGYSAALLAGLVAKVVLVDDDKALLALAKRNVAEFKNITCVQAGVDVGAPKHGPYDAILLDAAVGHVPPALLSQLRDGGKLATVRPGADGVLEACVVVKHGSAVFEEALFETKGHVLPALQVAESFVF